MQKIRSGNASVGQPTRIMYSTTDGRQRFPDILQISYGEKAVIGFDRYGRALGAVVPMEAVWMLAGLTGGVDEDVKARIVRAAQKLLDRVSTGEDVADLDELRSERDRAPQAATAKPRTRARAS